jgi:hypothetical protein
MLHRQLRPAFSSVSCWRPAFVARSFATSTRTFKSFHDPQDPRLFYHGEPAQHRLYLSFLPTPSPRNSPTIIGSIPAPPSAEESSSADDDTPSPSSVTPPTPDTFVENPEWLELVHAVLAVRFQESVTLQTLAKARLDEGYIHIIGAFFLTNPSPNLLHFDVLIWVTYECIYNMILYTRY